MGKASHQLQRRGVNELKLKRRRAARELRARQAAEGLKVGGRPTISNSTCLWETVQEEEQARQEAVQEHAKAYRAILPELLERLAQIPDPRNPKTVKHQSTVLLLYGILSFVFQMGSRREANRKMTMPLFKANLSLIFPELETLPHHDTLNRVLSKIDVDQIESAQLDLVEGLIRNKKFTRHLISNCYPIAIDGTQKVVRDWCWDDGCLERQVSSKEKDGTESTRPQYYVYVVEANLAFANGMTIPLMTEFLDYGKGDQETNKQDCERKAFERLAERLKERFPRLPIMVLLDGLYPNGPVLQLCKKNRWQYMIVLQDGNLPSVWEEARGLAKLQLHNRLNRTWGNRKQCLRWVNDIEYRWGESGRRKQTLHVVVCEETWEEVDPNSAEIVTKRSKHAWLSSEPLSRENVHERCNLGARHRWGIESSYLIEKRQGYQYEHCFSHNRQAMKGYHYLMRLGHLINTLVHRTSAIAKLVGRLGVRGVIEFVRTACAGSLLDGERIRQVFASPCQIRLE
jgi:hypothetical protein